LYRPDTDSDGIHDTLVTDRANRMSPPYGCARRAVMGDQPAFSWRRLAVEALRLRDQRLQPEVGGRRVMSPRITSSASSDQRTRSPSSPLARSAALPMMASSGTQQQIASGKDRYISSAWLQR
jgi:hypothetical protein